MRKMLKSAALVVYNILLIISSCDKEPLPVTIKVGYLPMVSSLTHFIALDRGYYTEDNPEAAERFFRAIDKAVRYIRQNPSEAREILAIATSTDIDIANKMNIMPMALSTEIDLANLDGYLEILYQMGEISLKPRTSDICIKQGK